MSSAHFHLQASQFWRPSAWADAVHAYTPEARRLTAYGRFFRSMSAPNIFLPGVFPEGSWLGLSMIFQAENTWAWATVKWALVFTFLALCWSARCGRIKAAISANVAMDLDQSDAPDNMPTLLLHMSQLEAAGRLIKAHCLAEPSSRQHCSANANLSSNLALIHAMRSQQRIMAHLAARLALAFHVCTGKTLSHLGMKPTQEGLKSIARFMTQHRTLPDEHSR